MTCPKCGNFQALVVDSRSKPFGMQRRRECQRCGHRFNTAEITMEEYKGIRHTKCTACPWLKM